MVKFFLSVMAIGILSSCSKTEQYASATINGIEYVEIKTSNMLFEANPSSIIIVEDCDVALYHTLLKPLTEGYPKFEIKFLIPLKDIGKLEINKSYKILGIKTSEEYNWVEAVEKLETTLPAGYDGVAYCYKEGIDESFLLEGEFLLERYESTTGYYYGSYLLTNSSEKDDSLNIKGNIKVLEITRQLN